MEPLVNGAERDRTAGLQSAILALSQLSYCPKDPQDTFGPPGHQAAAGEPTFSNHGT